MQQTLELIDIAKENDLNKYREICRIFLLEIKDLIFLLETHLKDLHAEDYSIIYDKLCFLRAVLLGVEPNYENVDYIGVSPCIDTFYTTISWIQCVILHFDNNINTTKSLSILQIYYNSLEAATTITKDIKRKINAIISNQTFARNMGLLTKDEK